MNDKILAYLISLGIMGSGIFWIVMSAHSAASVIYIAIGIPTIVVGLISFFAELRQT
jgi:apolipoprotein N-acyltransferase